MVFLQGFLLGLAYAAPIGMQNIFVINNALSRPLLQAAVITAAVIFFDITLAMACFFSAGFVMEYIPLLQTGLSLFGAFIVLYFAWNLFRSAAASLTQPAENRSVFRAVAAACAVTWFNPQALIDGALFLGSFRASLAPEDTLLFIFGAAAASFSWFTSITLGLHFFRARIQPAWLTAVNRICGAVMALYAVQLLYRAGQFF